LTILALLSLHAVLAAAPARAADAAAYARFELVVGSATAATADAKRSVKTGDALAEGDVIETADAATAVVRLADGSRLKLRGGSRLQLTPATPGSRATEVLLSLGGVFAQIAKRAAGTEFRVRTAAAVAAVRGTRFFTAFGRERGKERDLWVCVDEGLVEVGVLASKDRRNVPAGKGILIKGERDVTKPQRYDWTKKLNWNMDPAKGTVEDKTNMDSAYADLLDQDYR
jgi:hypothetical protein